jgi:hypothetical protein
VHDFYPGKIHTPEVHTQFFARHDDFNGKKPKFVNYL